MDARKLSLEKITYLTTFGFILEKSPSVAISRIALEVSLTSQTLMSIFVSTQKHETHRREV